MSGEMFEREFRKLQELVEEGYLAVSGIGPSEIRLMNKPISEALAKFRNDAAVVVVDLII